MLTEGKPGLGNAGEDQAEGRRIDEYHSLGEIEIPYDRDRYLQYKDLLDLLASYGVNTDAFSSQALIGLYRLYQRHHEKGQALRFNPTINKKNPLQNFFG